MHSPTNSSACGCIKFWKEGYVDALASNWVWWSSLVLFEHTGGVLVVGIMVLLRLGWTKSWPIWAIACCDQESAGCLLFMIQFQLRWMRCHREYEGVWSQGSYAILCWQHRIYSNHERSLSLMHLLGVWCSFAYELVLGVTSEHGPPMCQSASAGCLVAADSLQRSSWPVSTPLTPMGVVCMYWVPCRNSQTLTFDHSLAPPCPPITSNFFIV